MNSPGVKQRIMQHEAAVLAIAAALLHLLLGLLLLTPTPYGGGDNGVYVALARSLLQGRYVELWDPAQRAVTLYPPLFPLTLAAAMLLGLKSWLQLKVVSLLISAAAIAMSVLWLRRVGGRLTAIAGAVLLASSPGVLEQASFVLSEGLCWFFVMLALWCMAHIEKGVAAHQTRWIIAAAVSTAAAVLARSAGIPLLVAIALVFMLRRQWRNLLTFCAVAVPPVFVWSLRGKLLGAPGYTSYLTMRDVYRPDLGRIGPGEFVIRVVTNIGKYFTELLPTLLWGMKTALVPLLIVVVVMALAWWLLRLFKAHTSADIFLLLYGGVVLAWPQAWAGERFILAVLPVLIFLFCDLVRFIAARARIAGWVVAVAAVLLMLLPVPAVLAGRITAAAECRSTTRATDPYACMEKGIGDFMRVAAAAGSQLPKDAVVISRKPTLFYSESGLPSRMYPLSADTAWFFAAADSSRARYVVIDQISPLAELYLNPIVKAASTHFCVQVGLSFSYALLLEIVPPRVGPAPPASSDGSVLVPTCPR